MGLETINLKLDLTFQSEPEQIVDRNAKSLRNKEMQESYRQGDMKRFSRWQSYVEVGIRDAGELSTSVSR